jgi:hypothetical protein
MVRTGVQFSPILATVSEYFYFIFWLDLLWIFFCWTSVVSMVSGWHNRVKLTNNSHYEEVEGDEGGTTCSGQSVFSHSMFAWLGVVSQVNTATLLLACSSLFNDKFSHNPQQKVSPPVCKNGLMISAFLSLTLPWVGWLIYWHSMHKKLLETHAHNLVILRFAACKPWRRIQFLVANLVYYQFEHSDLIIIVTKSTYPPQWHTCTCIFKLGMTFFRYSS